MSFLLENNQTLSLVAIKVYSKSSVSVLSFVDRHLGLSVELEWIRTKIETGTSPLMVRLRV